MERGRKREQERVGKRDSGQRRGVKGWEGGRDMGR
mgnify:CR=1 FL=1